jgi:hypothetical protein
MEKTFWILYRIHPHLRSIKVRFVFNLLLIPDVRDFFRTAGIGQPGPKARIGHLGKDIKNRKDRTGWEHDNEDKTAGIRKQGDKSAWTRQAGQERTAWAGQPRKDSWTGQKGKDGYVMTVRIEQLERTVEIIRVRTGKKIVRIRTGKRGQSGQNMKKRLDSKNKIVLC